MWFGWATVPGSVHGPRNFRHELPTGPAADELMAAVDECAVIGRPLTDAEVAALAGRKPAAAPAPRPKPARPLAPPPRAVGVD